MQPMTNSQIAQVTHEARRAYRQARNDPRTGLFIADPWNDLTDEQQAVITSEITSLLTYQPVAASDEERMYFTLAQQLAGWGSPLMPYVQVTAPPEQAADRTPTVGRPVHYVSHGTPPGPDGSQAFPSQCRAAIITEYEPAPASLPGVMGRTALMIANPTGLFFNQNVPHDQGIPVAMDAPEAVKAALGQPAAVVCGGNSYQAGTWHWS